MENIKRYSDDELSLRVFNEEWLYVKRHDPGFVDFVREIYHCSEKQIAVLVEDLKEDLEAIQRYKEGVKPWKK